MFASWTKTRSALLGAGLIWSIPRPTPSEKSPNLRWNMALTQFLRTQNKVHAPEVVADGARPFVESFKAISAREPRALPGSSGATKRSRENDVLVRSTRRAMFHGVLSGELARTIQRWAKVWRVAGLRDRVTVHFNARLRTT